MPRKSFLDVELDKDTIALVEREAAARRVHPDEFVRSAIIDFLSRSAESKRAKINKLIESPRTKFDESARAMLEKIPEPAIDRVWGDVINEDDNWPPTPPDPFASIRKRGST